MSATAEKIHHRHGLGTTPPPRHEARHEPGRTTVHDEFDARNAMLDLFEHQVRSLLAAGLEPQVRTRLERLLPSAQTQAPVEPADVWGSDPFDTFTWSKILVALRYAGKGRLTESEAKAVRHARDLVLTQVGEAAI